MTSPFLVDDKRTRRCHLPVEGSGYPWTHEDATVLTSADAELCAAAARHGLQVANPLAN